VTAAPELGTPAAPTRRAPARRARHHAADVRLDDQAAEPAADRAARLALALAGDVAEIRAGRGRRMLQQARLDLAELEALLAVEDLAIPAPVTAPSRKARQPWEGFAPPPDEAQDAAALACWAALGEPVEAHLLTWRAVIGARA
jgi:hypothetical protein